MLGRHALLAASVAALSACSADLTTLNPNAPVVTDVIPASGATGVNVSAPIVVTFSQAMMQGMEMDVVLHEGSVTGAAVVGTSSWSTDRKTLTFTPSSPLKHATSYVLHLAPTMMDSDGQKVDHGACAAIGGQNVTSSMMGGSSGGMMGGSSMGPGMMGSNWQMANGSYGMIFPFTTA